MLASGRSFSIQVGIVISLVFGRCDCYSQTEALANKVSEESELIVRTEVQEVNLIFTITDHRGHFIDKLTPAEITVRDNGEIPKRITHFETQADLPLRVALVIDSSNSVLGWFNSEKYVADAFLKQTLRKPSDRALIVGFNEQARIAQGPTRDYRLLSRAIKKLPPGGNTAIYDAVDLASRKLGNIGNYQPSRRAIILITDGDDNSSHMTLQQAAEACEQNESIVYVMNTSQEPWRNNQAELAMKQFSEATGGQYWRADNEARISNAFDKIMNGLRSQYAIAYQPANIKPDGSFHLISVLVPKKLLVHHRRGYFAR